MRLAVTAEALEAMDRAAERMEEAARLLGAMRAPLPPGAATAVGERMAGIEAAATRLREARARVAGALAERLIGRTDG